MESEMSAKKLIPILLLILGFVNSCGSVEKEKKKLLIPNESQEMTNVFDDGLLQDEVFKKKESQVEEEVKKVDKKGSKNKVGKKSKSLTSKKVPTLIQPLLNEAVTKNTLEIKDTKKEKSYIYPLDYPQLFKAYDSQSAALWSKLKPSFYQGEESIMAISYLGVTAGYITISSKDIVNINDKKAYYYYARFKSKELYRYFYWLDDKIETYIDKLTFLPIKYSLVQREKKQNVDDLQLFNFEELKTHHWYKRVKDGSDKNEKVVNFIPRYAQDSFSALQFVRGLPMNKGDQYDFPVITRGSAWLLKVEVIGQEMTSVDGNKILAYKLKAETHFPGVLQKSGDISFWYAADSERRLLKFQAKIKIGSIFGELVQYKHGVLVK